MNTIQNRIGSTIERGDSKILWQKFYVQIHVFYLLQNFFTVITICYYALHNFLYKHQNSKLILKFLSTPSCFLWNSNQTLRTHNCIPHIAFEQLCVYVIISLRLITHNVWKILNLILIFYYGLFSTATFLMIQYSLHLCTNVQLFFKSPSSMVTFLSFPYALVMPTPQ